MKRREMMAGVLALGGTALLQTSCGVSKTPHLGVFFIHHVLFWLKNPDDVKDCQEFEVGLRNLMKIELVKNFQIGRPAATKRDVVENTYTYSIVTCFKTKEDHDIYQTHPDHLLFINKYSRLWEKVVVIDTENCIDEQSVK